MSATSPTPKERARRVVNELPDDATYEDVIARLVVVHKVERGLAQVRSGEDLKTQDEVEAEFARRREARA
jgi:hypothetical protein